MIKFQIHQNVVFDQNFPTQNLVLSIPDQIKKLGIFSFKLEHLKWRYEYGLFATYDLPVSLSIRLKPSQISRLQNYQVSNSLQKEFELYRLNYDQNTSYFETDQETLDWYQFVGKDPLEFELYVLTRQEIQNPDLTFTSTYTQFQITKALLAQLKTSVIQMEFRYQS